MKKFLFLLFLIYSVSVFADFIIPKTDPVYEFLEMTNTLKKSNLNHFQYPLYYNSIMAALKNISDDRTAGLYQNQAYFHQKRLSMNYKEGTQFAVYPPQKTLSSINELFRKNPTHKRLVTITDFQSKKNSLFPIFSSSNNETFLYISGILGYNHDYKKEDDTVRRERRYYGIESAGNFSPNFGYYISFRKGHYIGDADFITENPFISRMGDNHYADDDKYYQVDMISELDFKNPYLNLSVGYGSFDIGKSITSSVILNNDVTPYGYFKYNKKFGILEYNGITTQLIPDSLKNNTDYKPKSMAIQTISLHTSSISFGLGNSIIYGDRSFDIAYSSPLAIYKIMDNKNHGRDNGLFFGFGEVRPLSGLNLYGNILFDDIRNDRFKSNKALSYAALQGGMLYQISNLPMEVGGEITAVGPSTYAHKSRQLTYMHDDMLLGSKHGSNFLSFASRVRFHFTRVSFSLFYENIQQGDIGFHPSAGSGDQEFLANNISRKEFFKANINFRIIPELLLFSRYEYNKLPDKELHYIYSGAEFKY